ncbi:MAG: DNA internalization-related competence protein ComEC/Rec2 [Clostridia bacterium]|nr:DNA internalization-related competence protein ComEC/Rec2 [Clostridia bacterium]
MRKLATFALSFSAAVFLLRYGFPAVLFLPLVLVCALLSALQRPYRLRLILVGTGLVTALLWTFAYDTLIRAPARAMEGETVTITAPVTDFPRPTARGVSVTVDLGFAARALVYLEPEFEVLMPGDELTVTAVMKPSDVLRGEDTDAYTAKSIYLIAAPKSGMAASVRPDAVPWRYWPALWSRALRTAIASAFPADVSPLVNAVVTGNRDALSDGFTTSLQRSGLAHAVSVSGMHISFLAGVIFTLSGRYKKRTALLLLPTLVLFALAAGCTPSVVRAVVMQSLFLLAPLFSRESDTPTNLSCALLLLLIQNPYAAASVSLQLSFASVAGIVLFSGRMFRAGWEKLPWKNPAVKFVWASVTTTLGALALTTPLLAYYFGTVSLIAPLSNLLSLWAVSFVFLGGLLAGVLTLLCPLLGIPVAALTAPVARYLNWLIPVLARAPYAAVALDSVLFAAWLVFAYGVVILALAWPGKGKRPAVPACCILITLCASLVLNGLIYRVGALTVTVLDVGQGGSAVLRAGTRVALVDCGGNESRNAGDVAADYLEARGVGTLDILVLTHFHSDHANGVMELLERMRVSVLAVPDVREENPLKNEILAYAAEKGTQIVTVSDDVTLPFAAADLTLYAPLGAGEANEEGLSVLCAANTFAALFTGDMDESVEKRLVKYGALPDLDLLMAGHHGAKTSTSQLLLDAVTPELVAFSVGYNTYGHPNPDTLLRVAGSGAEIYRTDLQGNITFTVK